MFLADNTDVSFDVTSRIVPSGVQVDDVHIEGHKHDEELLAYLISGLIMTPSPSTKDMGNLVALTWLIGFNDSPVFLEFDHKKSILLFFTKRLKHSSK